MTLHWTDITIIALCFFSVAYSAYRGMMRELFSLGSLFFGFILANRYYLFLLPYLEDIFGEGGLANFLSFALLFFLLYIVFHLTGSLIQKKVIDTSDVLTGANRLIGAGIGMVKAMLILSLLYIPLHSFSYTDDYLEENSEYIPYVRKATAITTGFISDNPLVEDYSFIENIERGARNGFEDLQETISEGVKEGIGNGITEKLFPEAKSSTETTTSKRPQPSQKVTDKHTEKDMQAMDAFLDTITGETSPKK